MSRTEKYFNGDIELTNVYMVTSKWSIAAGGKKVSTYQTMVGTPITGEKCIMPATRWIHYSNKPSLHKCDARCMGAKGHNCECSCGGKNHGINS
jgi:hypothetical protein